MDGSYTLASISLILSFIIAIILTKGWIRIARKTGLVGKDKNKFNGRQIAESGGIGVIFAIISGILFYIFFKTFLLQSKTHLVLILAVSISLLLAGFLGFIDDILGWKKGLRQFHKVLLTVPIAIPLMVLNVGQSTINIPIFGNIDLGLFYPLILIPIAIVGASNGFNMLAGMNGLESGMGVIILSTLGIVSWFQGLFWLTLIAFISVFALLGFLMFNWYPAKAFPGDSLTYGIGALIAMLSILGNMEKIGLFLFAPYFAEFLIKTKNRMRSECFGVPQKDRTLKSPEKIGSITHIILRYTKTEKGVVYTILFIELIVAAAILVIQYG